MHNLLAVFKLYYVSLVFYASRLVGESEAEDVVQQVFVDLWVRRETLRFGDKTKALLYKAVYTRCLNVLSHRKVRNSYDQALAQVNRLRAEYYGSHLETHPVMENEELREELDHAIAQLPEKCRQVFTLSYLHGLKNKEIAQLLGLSPRTVENHISKALKILRERLRRFYGLALLFMSISA